MNVKYEYAALKKIIMTFDETDIQEALIEKYKIDTRGAMPQFCIYFDDDTGERHAKLVLHYEKSQEAP